MYNNYQRRGRDNRYGSSGGGNLSRVIHNDYFQRNNNSRNRKPYNFKKINNDDDPMDNSSSRKSRFAPYSSNKRKSEYLSQSVWFKVILANGQKYNKQELFTRLHKHLEPIQLLPICPKVDNADLIFYVDSDTTAMALKNANLKIHLADGWKLQIKIDPYKLPDIELSQDVKDKVASVIAKRYDVGTNALDLSKIYMDADLLRNELFLPLTMPSVMYYILQLIIRNIGHVQKIDLSNNKLILVEHLAILTHYTKNLKMLDLSYNRIKQLRDLSMLQGLEIEDINLDCNPLCDQYDSKDDYIRELRKIFPRVYIVDGIVFQPVTYVSTKLPTPQKSFIIPEAVSTVELILQEYFSMFDSDTSRQGLVTAYANDARFSMSAYTRRPGSRLHKFITKSRNMLAIRAARRNQLLHRGWNDILTALEELPKTKHYLNLFTIDLSYYSGERLVLTITGVFEEKNTRIPREDDPNAIRTFSSVMVIQQLNGVLKITNNLLTVTDISKEQFMFVKWNKIINASNTEAPTVTHTESVVPVAAPEAMQQELAIKQQMITTLANQTGMNIKWSEKCLVETNWTYDNAYQAFVELNANGNVPPEAFVK